MNNKYNRMTNNVIHREQLDSIGIYEEDTWNNYIHSFGNTFII